VTDNMAFALEDNMVKHDDIGFVSTLIDSRLMKGLHLFLKETVVGHFVTHAQYLNFTRLNHSIQH